MRTLVYIFVLILASGFYAHAQDINMQNGAVNQCSGTLFDSGGAGSYTNNENFTLTICAENTGDAVQLDFTFFDTQASADYLTIYDGNDTSATVLGVFDGNTSPGVILATNSSGCLTLTFESSPSISKQGFEANISCATPCQDIEAFVATTDPPAGLGGNIVINQGDTVDFTGGANFSLDGTGATYDWDFGGEDNATTDSGDTVVSHTFNNIGTFTVTLTVTDANPTGCSDSTTIVVQVLGPYLLVDQTTYSVEQLVEDILVNSSCVEISNIVSSTGTDFGSTNGIGYFSGNGVSFPFTEGILLTTGDASEAEGPETGNPLGSGSTAWTGDLDLENAIPDLSPGQTTNATFIQFDFIPLANSISFNFVFASEEYGQYQCEYTDAFAFLLTNNTTGQTTNLALVPGTNDPISVLSVRDGAYNAFCSSSNEEFFAAYYGAGGLPAIDSPIDFIGHTVSMLAQSAVAPNTSYTIKLVIADDGNGSDDTVYDAAVFLEAGSFDLGGNLGNDVTIEDGNALCLGDAITLDSNFPGAEHIWYLDGNVIENESSSTLEISVAGTYTVDISFGVDCVASDSILIEYKLSPTIEAISDLTLCNAGSPTFDLTENTTLILGTQNPGDFNITYHNALAAAENDNTPITTNLTNYAATSNPETIFVRIEDALTESCFVTGSFNLVLTDGPPISNVSNLVLCDDLSNDGIEEFNLEAQRLDILGTLNPGNYNVTYYTTFEDANVSQNELPLLYSSTTNQPIYVRIDSVDDEDCYSVSPNPLFNLIVTNKATATNPGPMVVCDDGSGGYFSFDLESQTTTILDTQDPTTFTVTYHATQSDADNNTAALSSPFTNTVAYGQPIYVRVEEAGLPNCYETTEFDLIVELLPTTTTMTSLPACDDDADGITAFILTDKDVEALGGQTGVTVSYHATQSDADNNTAALSSPYTNTTAYTQQIFIRLTSATNCYSTMPLDLVVNPLPVPELDDFLPSKCDDDTDGLQTFDMSGVAADVIGTQSDMVVSYHLTLADAEDNTGALGNSITMTTPDVQTIYIRLENTLTNCYATRTIDLVVDPLPVVDLDNNYVICADASGGGLDYVVIDPGLSAGTYNFIWRDEFGVVLSSDPTYRVDQGGIYSLEVSYNSTGCSSPLEIFTVSESGSPAVTVDVVTEDFADTHVVIATATGTGLYEFSLDQGPWQDSGTFIGVGSGEHTVYIRDVNGCGTTPEDIYIVGYPKYFTPNGDGYHDTWNIGALSGQLGSRIYIFDRYGKLLKQISPASDGWDGTYNGKPMPTSDYWFMLEYNDLKTGQPKQRKAHFSLKR